MRFGILHKPDSNSQELPEVVYLPAWLRKLRAVLNIVGGCGFVLWLALCGLGWLFRDFKPGGSVGGLSSWQSWFCTLVPAATFIYYTGIGLLYWSKHLFLIGVLLHLLLLGTITLLAAFTDGGFILIPVLLIGPILWIVFSVEIGRLNQTLEETHAKD